MRTQLEIGARKFTGDRKGLRLLQARVYDLFDFSGAEVVV